MGINVSLAKSQANKISNYESVLKSIKSNLNGLKCNLNNEWQAQEMVYINNAIDNINSDISRSASALDSLSHDISNTAYEIKEEEEEREALEAARLAQIKK